MSHAMKTDNAGAVNPETGHAGELRRRPGPRRGGVTTLCFLLSWDAAMYHLPVAAYNLPTHSTAAMRQSAPLADTSGNPHSDKPFEHAPEHAHDRLDRKDERNHGTTIEDTKRTEKLEDEADEER